jgi:hypothetical protein
LEKSWNLDIQKNESKKMEIQKFGKSKKLNFDAASGGAASRPATYYRRRARLARQRQRLPCTPRTTRRAALRLI